MNKSNMKYRLLGIFLFIILSINMVVALFGVLSVSSVNSTDEACHGINAYEMLRNGNIWINTLKYEIDYYNSKPPLMLWLIMIGYKIFGYNSMGLRIGSAVCGFILYLVGSLFACKKINGLSALLFAAFLPACTLLLKFHMMRSGDMDSLYVLCFTLAMMGLVMAEQKITWLILYGVAFGLAFMTKSTHAVLIILIGLMCIPFLIKFGMKIRHIVMAAVAAVIMILPWFIQRVRFDRLAFFKDMILGETIGRVEGSAQKSDFKDFFDYIIQMIKEPICDIAFVIIIAAICVRYYRWKKASLNGRFKDFIINLIDYKRYVLIMWFIVVLGAFSAARSSLEWYIYSAYIPLIMMAAECGAYLIRVIYVNGHKFVSGISALLIIAIALSISINNISEYQWNGTGGDPVINLSEDMIALLDNTELELSGQNAYIETSYNDYKFEGGWELNCVFYLETILDMRCVDGGVSDFLATDDMNAILFLDKNLWDQYSGVLTGYVILQDNNYLIFSKHKYGE